MEGVLLNRSGNGFVTDELGTSPVNVFFLGYGITAVYEAFITGSLRCN